MYNNVIIFNKNVIIYKIFFVSANAGRKNSAKKIRARRSTKVWKKIIKKLLSYINYFFYK